MKISFVRETSRSCSIFLFYKLVIMLYKKGMKEIRSESKIRKRGRASEKKDTVVVILVKSRKKTPRERCRRRHHNPDREKNI